MPIEFVAKHRHSEHPDFSARKELAAKAFVSLHLGLRDRSGTLKSLEETLRQRAGQDAKLNKSLDRYLDQVAGEIRIRGRGFARFRRKQEVQDFEQAVSSLRCRHCTHSKDRCRGHSVFDPRKVAEGGLCLAFFTATFDRLVELAAKHYARAIGPLGRHILSIKLETAIDRAGDAVGGNTTYPDEDNVARREAVVEIILPLEKFDKTHLSELPYIMFHEIFVHCPESWGTRGPRPITDESCAFREGFVDAAGAFVLRRALRRRELTLFGQQDLRSYFALSTAAAHNARVWAGPRRPGGKASMDVVTLRETGAMLFGEFEDHGLGDQAALLAAVMNSWISTPAERGAFITMLENVAAQLPLGGEGCRSATQSLFEELGRALFDGSVDSNAVRRCLSIKRTIDDYDF